MSTTTSGIVRDCAIVLWAYCFNGLRDSSVATQLSTYVSMNGQRVTARLSMVKGRSVIEFALISYDRPSDLPSAYDL